jgi:hypothetical protein
LWFKDVGMGEVGGTFEHRTPEGIGGGITALLKVVGEGGFVGGGINKTPVGGKLKTVD